MQRRVLPVHPRRSELSGLGLHQPEQDAALPEPPTARGLTAAGGSISVSWRIGLTVATVRSSVLMVVAEKSSSLCLLGWTKQQQQQQEATASFTLLSQLSCACIFGSMLQQRVVTLSGIEWIGISM
jgi:hypothetical protein